jgi:putative hemin transport protein
MRAAWQALRERTLGIRPYDAARELGVSEAAFVATQVGGEARRLGGDFADLLRAMPTVGETKVFTRNAHCVHERVGCWQGIDIMPGAGVVVGPEIDLRVFMGHWRHGFALEQPSKDGTLRRSLQFFDGEGHAVHKIYLQESGCTAAWDDLVARFAVGEQHDRFEALAYPKAPPPRPDADIDAEGLSANWAALQDVHDFFSMLKDFGVAREQAFRLVGETFAHRVTPSSLEHMLRAAAAASLPIMVFVGNRGCIQIHTGPVEDIKVMGPWLNVLDARFNLHLRWDAIATAWVVRKPTRDGVVTSLEVFDKDGVNFAMFFGERKPGKPELPAWRDLVGVLERLP